MRKRRGRRARAREVGGGRGRCAEAALSDPAAASAASLPPLPRLLPPASRPADDIPPTVADPEASQPDDWDTEEDGEWEAPQVPNPEYKGPWVQPMKPNPEYKGEWAPKQIDNEAYAPDTYAKYEDIGVAAFELWTVNSGSVFDNILVTDDEEAAKTERDAILANAEAEKEAREEHKKANEPEPEDEEEYAEDDEDDEEEEIAMGGHDASEL